MAKKARAPKRGHPVGLILGFEPMGATLWKIYTGRAVLISRMALGRKFENAEKAHAYPFYEGLIAALRPLIKEGLKSILVASPPKTAYGAGFLAHARAHHQWLFKPGHPMGVAFQEITGRTANAEQMAFFLESPEYQAAIAKATGQEADEIVNLLEARLNDGDTGLVLFSLAEIEKLIFAGGKRKKKFKPLKLLPEYIVLTAEYIEAHPQKGRVHQLLQLAENRAIKTKIIDSSAPAADRLAQLGGIACFLQVNSDYERQLGEELLKTG